MTIITKKMLDEKIKILNNKFNKLNNKRIESSKKGEMQYSLINTLYKIKMQVDILKEWRSSLEEMEKAFDKWIIDNKYNYYSYKVMVKDFKNKLFGEDNSQSHLTGQGSSFASKKGILQKRNPALNKNGEKLTK